MPDYSLTGLPDYNELSGDEFIRRLAAMNANKAAPTTATTTPPTTAPSTTPPTKDTKKKMSEETKQGLITAGVNTLGGILGGLAQALMYEDESKKIAGHGGIPSGTVGGVGHTNTPNQLTAGRMDLPDSQKLALAMLQLGKV